MTRRVRTARKQHRCSGGGEAHWINPGEQYEEQITFGVSPVRYRLCHQHSWELMIRRSEP